MRKLMELDKNWKERHLNSLEKEHVEYFWKKNESIRRDMKSELNQTYFTPNDSAGEEYKKRVAEEYKERKHRIAKEEPFDSTTRLGPPPSETDLY